MEPVLVDSNVLLDIATSDPTWGDWSGPEPGILQPGILQPGILPCVQLVHIRPGFRVVWTA